MKRDGASVPERGHPAHPAPVARHNQPMVLMVSVALRQPNAYRCLDNATVHAALLTAWRTAQEWLPGLYLIMPDHVHLFCVPGGPEAPSVKAWCKKWKSLTSMALGQHDWRWLPDCWDTQMRDREQYNEKLAYVRMNPVRKGLVAQPEEWPHQGTLNTILW
jgi:putative transposase